MPIFSYFAVVGSVMVALLFAADATLPKQGPAIVSSDFYGMPKPWRPDPQQTLVTAAAPAPDMASEAVQTAMPKATPAPERTVTAEAAPVRRKKHIARKQSRPDDTRFAWSRGNEGGAGGGNFFGRF
jgi:hypothetical protein